MPSKEFWEVANEALLAMLKLVLPVLLAYLARKAVPALVALRLEAEARVGVSNLKMLEGLVRAAVYAAEAAGVSSKLKGLAIDKFGLARAKVQAGLEAQGVYMDTETISNVIEAMVFDEFNRYRTRPAAGESH